MHRQDQPQYEAVLTGVPSKNGFQAQLYDSKAGNHQGMLIVQFQPPSIVVQSGHPYFTEMCIRHGLSCKHGYDLSAPAGLPEYAIFFAEWFFPRLAVLDPKQRFPSLLSDTLAAFRDEKDVKDGKQVQVLPPPAEQGRVREEKHGVQLEQEEEEEYEEEPMQGVAAQPQDDEDDEGDEQEVAALQAAEKDDEDHEAVNNVAQVDEHVMAQIELEQNQARENQVRLRQEQVVDLPVVDIPVPDT